MKSIMRDHIYDPTNVIILVPNLAQTEANLNKKRNDRMKAHRNNGRAKNHQQDSRKIDPNSSTREIKKRWKEIRTKIVWREYNLAIKTRMLSFQVTSNRHRWRGTLLTTVSKLIPSEMEVEDNNLNVGILGTTTVVKAELRRHLMTNNWVLFCQDPLTVLSRTLILVAPMTVKRVTPLSHRTRKSRLPNQFTCTTIKASTHPLGTVEFKMKIVPIKTK